MNAVLMTTQELINYTKTFAWSRPIRQLHIHHTWKPDHSDYNGSNGIELQNGMRKYHVNTNGWSDIAQHLTLLPDGRWITGRNFNSDPASIQGWNDGAFCIEMVGNFDVGHDKFEGRQAEAMLEFCSFFVLEMKLNTITDVKFHRDSPTANKTCPGTGIDRNWFMRELRSRIALLRSPKKDTEAWKFKGIDGLAATGLINDPQGWRAKINEPIPVWAAMIIMDNIYRKLSGKGEAK